MQRTDRIDVLTTQLAATDRRALSQAWYSALHLAEHSPRGIIASGRRAGTTQATTVSRGPSTRAPSPDTPGPAHAATSTARAVTRGRTSETVAAERRVAKSPLARKLERALAHHGCEHPSSFALRSADGRIHLTIRTDGARTRLVAICAPSLRARVERALAQARFALAGRGLMTEVA
jgi:hypothetical protein